MPNSNTIKIALDTILFINLALVMTISRGTFHEIASLGMGCLLLTHIFLNLQWVKKVSARLYNSRLKRKTHFSYLINHLLFVSMLMTIVTGILMSKVLFPGIGLPQGVREIHSIVANVSLILVGIHMGLYWQRLVSCSIQVFNSEFQKVIGRVTLLLIASFLLFGGYKFVSDQVPVFKLQQQALPNSNLSSYAIDDYQYKTGITGSSDKMQPHNDGSFEKEHNSPGPIGFILNSIIILAIALTTHKLKIRRSHK